jgi:homocysteine S-methyltransferase
VSEDDGGTLGAWSATAMVDAPEVVRAIYEDYLRTGADVVTANSYNTNRGQLATVGMADRMEELSRLSVVLACEARDRLNPKAYVAGAIAPTSRFPQGWDAARVAPAAQLARDWGDQAAVLADAGADLILIETMSAIFQLLPALEAARNTGLPVLLGIHPTPQGTMQNGESMQQLIAALDGLEPDAILLMCRPPEDVSATLPRLREAFPGPIGAYANIGYGKDPEDDSWQYHTIDIGSNTPRRYAETCQEWLNMGAQIIGGCCGTTPEHIAALRPLVRRVRA